jgi:protein O-GlcNAc transferase
MTKKALLESTRPATVVAYGQQERPTVSAADLAALLAQAQAMHQAGLLTDAEGLYRKLLLACPEHVEALQMLGVIEYQRGDSLAALRRIDHALSIDPRAASAYNNRGVVLAGLKRFEEAVGSYDRAIALVPDYVDAIVNRGNALREHKRFDEALASYDRAIALNASHADVFNKRGNVLTELRRFGEAVASYDRAVALNPALNVAFNNRGVALAKLKRFAEAVESYDKALALKPNDIDALNNRGQALVELKRFNEAVAAFDKSIALDVNNPDALNSRGRALADLGRFDEALASYDQAIALNPTDAEAFNNRGNAFNELKRFELALASYDRAIALKPADAIAFYNRGNVLGALERFEEAVASYDRAVALDPNYAHAMNNRGNVLRELGRVEEALASYDRAIGLMFDYADAINNRGNALKDLRRFADALASYDQAIVLRPDHAEYVNNRAIVLADLKRFDEALACYGRAIALKPDYAEAFSNRGFALRELKRFDEAVASFGQALALKPDMDYLAGVHLHAKMHVCDWTNFDDECARVSAAVADGMAASLPFPLLAMPASAEIQLQCAGIFSSDRKLATQAPIWKGDRYSHPRIRVAYLSSDLRDHPVTYLTAGMFERHDRTRFETIAISYKSDTAVAMRERQRASFDRFVDAQGMSDLEVAKLVRALEVGIAVDLNGFTEGMRPSVFARRPAPVQVNYLGYAGTLGQSYWDYILADRFIIPEHAQGNYAEKVVYLPETFMVTDGGRKIAARVPSRGEAGLPDSGFVFCCFNNSFKITPNVFDVWMRLLRAVEGSVLWLSAANTGAPNNLRREAERRGVAPDRLIFAPRVQFSDDHLARMRLADLFLDTLHYNAHATASDALWAGVPVLTCSGATFASRVAGSLLHAVGLPELTTSSLADYEALALTLARDPELLASFRQKLASQRETFPLFDTERFTRHIEAAYITMWERSQRGEAPQSFAVAAKGLT